MYEQGVVSKVDSGAFGYFKCTNKGCDPSQPMYMTVDDPKDQVGKGFTASFPLQLPYQQKSRQMTVSIIGTDQDHQPSDFTLGVQFNYTNTKEEGVQLQGTPALVSSLLLSKKGSIDAPIDSGGKTECKNDVDCPSSYCMSGKMKKQPYHCHACGPNCCNSDSDCHGSYCMNSPGKTAPFTCHAAGAINYEAIKQINWEETLVGSGGKTVCRNDVDCPSSYCMKGGGKSAPYHCHDCGEQCCNSDS